MRSVIHWRCFAFLSGWVFWPQLQKPWSCSATRASTTSSRSGSASSGARRAQPSPPSPLSHSPTTTKAQTTRRATRRTLGSASLPPRLQPPPSRRKPPSLPREDSDLSVLWDKRDWLREKKRDLELKTLLTIAAHDLNRPMACATASKSSDLPDLLEVRPKTTKLDKPTSHPPLSGNKQQPSPFFCSLPPPAAQSLGDRVRCSSAPFLPHLTLCSKRALLVTCFPCFSPLLPPPPFGSYFVPSYSLPTQHHNQNQTSLGNVRKRSPRNDKAKGLDKHHERQGIGRISPPPPLVAKEGNNVWVLRARLLSPLWE